MWLTCIRIFKFSLQDIARNFSLSFMTVLILILMLLSVNTLIVVKIITEKSIESIEDQIDVSVYFDPAASKEEITEVQKYIQSFPEVTENIFLNQDEVLTLFKETHRDNPEILTALDELGENPLGPTLIVKTREPEDYQKIITALNVPEYDTIIEAKTFSDTKKTIERISIITSHVERFSLALSIIFGIIGFIIIFNTIRVAIYTQRSEISIKRLVGATNWFISGPYIVDSFLFSLCAISINSGIVFFSARFLDPYIELIFQKGDILTNYFNSNIIFLLGTQFGAVFLLTLASSALAMRKYLRV